MYDPEARNELTDAERDQYADACMRLARIEEKTPMNLQSITLPPIDPLKASRVKSNPSSNHSSIRALTLLMLARAYPDLVLTDYAVLLQVSTCAITGLVDALHESGMVKRSPHPTDRRSYCLRLTKRGERLLNQITIDP